MTITNNTGSPLTQIDLIYTGGTAQIPELKPKASSGRRVNLDGDSHLVVEWVDAAGQKHSHGLDVYFEHNYRGRIDVTVQPDGEIAWTDKII